MPLGKTWQQTRPHYTIQYDETTGLWTIFDLWHSYWEDKEAEDDIEEGCPAIIKIPSGAFNELLREAFRKGYLDNYVPELMREEYQKKEDQEFPKPEEFEPQEPEVAASEEFRLSKFAIEEIVKLVGIQRIGGAIKGES